MTARIPQDLVLIAVVILLAGWVASVVIRLLEHTPVEVVAEMGGAAIAVGVIVDRLTGRRRNGSDQS